MDRELRETQRAMEALQGHMRAALLANNTRDASRHAEAVQAASAVAHRQLEGALAGGGGPSDGEGRSGYSDFLRAAVRAMSDAIERSERVALGSNIDEMRSRLIDVKTEIDYADAYLRAALGGEPA